MTNFQKSLIQRLAKSKAKKQNGFTLIELMIVVAIVGVLTAVGLPELSKAQDRAKDAAAVASLTNAAKQCSLELIVDSSTTYAFTGDFADVSGTCALDADDEIELILVSESGDGESTEAYVEFEGSVPGVVKTRPYSG